MKDTRLIRIVLHSDARNNQGDVSRASCVFDIPDVAMLSNDNSISKVELTVERFLVAANLQDRHHAFCLLADSFEQPDSYDTLTGSATRVIAVSGNPFRAQGSYNTSHDALYPVQISTKSFTNRNLTFRLVQPRVHSENVNARNAKITLVETLNSSVGNSVNVTVPAGFYQIDRGHPSLIQAIESALNNSSELTFNYTVEYDPVKQKVTIKLATTTAGASTEFQFDQPFSVGRTIGFTSAKHTVTNAAPLVGDDAVDLSLTTQIMSQSPFYEPLDRAWYAVLCFKIYQHCCDDCNHQQKTLSY